MVIATEFGNVEVGDVGICEGELCVYCDLTVIPDVLQKHINEVICTDKLVAFERKKDKFQRMGYQSLEEFEKENPVEIEPPYIGVILDLRSKDLRAELSINGYDTANKGVSLEFYHSESIAIDPRIILELLLTAAKKSAPTVQTIDPVVDDVY